jgi:hypothetical protein
MATKLREYGDFHIWRSAGRSGRHGRLAVRFIYDPGLSFSLDVGQDGQPVMRSLKCLNAQVTAQRGLSSDIFRAALEFLRDEG